MEWLGELLAILFQLFTVNIPVINVPAYMIMVFMIIFKIATKALRGIFTHDGGDSGKKGEKE
jgi:hypothetical protein